MRRSIGRLGTVCLLLGFLAALPAWAGAPDPGPTDHDARLVPREFVVGPREKAPEPPASLAPEAVCPTTVLASNGSTSGNGRAPSARFRGGRGVYLITAAELAANGLLSGSSPSAIGWRYSTGPGVAATGTLTVYLQNTSDSTYAKGTSFASAIVGMTTVHNASTTLPNTSAGFDVLFSSGSPFTYTGGGLYVAFDWRYPVGTLSGTVIIACNTELASGVATSQTTGTPPASDTLASSNFRPETRLTVTIGNDVSVDYVIALGQLPNGLVAPQVVGAVVTNRGNAQTNVPVTLNVTGAQTFTDTKTVAALAACGGQTTVSFAPFTPSVLGNDTVAVSVPADDTPANNSKSRNLETTVNRYSYKHAGTTPTGGVGAGGNTAEFVARFATTVTTQVDAVTVEFPASIPGAAYKVSIREDGGGTPGAQLYVDAADRNVVGGSLTIRLPAPVLVGPGDFYVGVQQTSTINMGLSFDQEVPIRSGAFFSAVGGGAFTDFAASGNNFKLNLGITIGSCLVPLSVDVNPASASVCAGNPLTFTAAATGGTGTVTYQWTENGGNLAGQTATSLIVTKPGAGTFNYNAKVTDDGGCVAIVDPAPSTGTWVGGGGPCDDGNACTGPDVCAGSVCAGPNPCDDANACTSDICGAGGSCSYTAVNCNDANPCTTDSCSPIAGCVNSNNALPCSDGNVCTLGDVCSGGLCVPGTAPLPSSFRVCETDTITIPDSGASSPYPSTINVTGQRSYLCGVTVELNGLSHTFPDDLDLLVARATGGNAIVMSDVGGGTDVSGLHLFFADAAASPLPDAGPLGSGTFQPTNVGGGDVFPPAAPGPSGGSALSVFDGSNPNGSWNLWVVDQFSPDGGSIANGWCVNLISICVGQEECDDASQCTVDACNPASGTCTHAAISCDDGDSCTADGCVPATGQCTHTPLVCDDGNACTDDSCNPASGCVFTVDDSNTCSDGNACTTSDTCAGGACNGGAPLPCNDGNVCTDDACDSQTGCVFTNNTAACNDLNPCTAGDTCGGGLCQPGVPLDCDDANPCTNDSCNPGTGACVHANNTVSCDDGNPCTLNDRCGAGSCQPGSSAVCNDGNVCTDDACDSQTGLCVFTPNTVSCSDGSFCTVDDVCANSVCVPGAPLVCDDANVCTTDTCSPGSGCVFTDNQNACDDGNACTNDDACDQGSCQPGQPTVCNDGDVCTADSCDPASGNCVYDDIRESCNDGNICTTDSCSPLLGCQYVNLEGACDDQSACTTGDTCSGGVCVSGTATVCVDGNACTDDTCDPLTGFCAFPNNTAACDDGNPCTAGDACGGGSCQTGAPIVPPEASALRASNKTTYTWTETLYASQYDAVRGSLGALPAGPGGDDEICFADLGANSFVDAATPALGTAFWYLVRGENGCFTGSYGLQSNGTPRVTSTCP